MPQIVDGNVLPMRAVALYDNNSETADELTFKSGDILTVLEFNFSGLQGWWLCSLRGKQGICPGNRLKILVENDLGSVDCSKSWLRANTVTPEKCDSYFYDEPKSVTPSQIQYDVVPNSHPPVSACDRSVEKYDVPRPLVPVGVSPASSLSSLTSDSNRSSTVQEYDVPKSSKRHQLSPILQPQEEYDVPRDLPLEMGPALEWLSRLEAEATSSVGVVLGFAVSNWRRRDKLEVKLADVRLAIHRLRTSLHDLVLFGRAALLNASNARNGSGGPGIAIRLKPLVDSLSESDSKVESCWHQLDAMGWAVESLSSEGCYTSPGGDPLDAILTAATPLQDDITRLASFVQGNARLLFIKKEDGDNKVWPEDYDYVNIECKERQQHEEGSCNKNDISLEPSDVKVLKFYGSQLSSHLNDLSSAVGSFIDSVEQSQPPRVFLSLVKLIILTGHKLVEIGDGASRCVGSKQMVSNLTSAADSLSDSLQSTVRTTKEAALHFPNINNVQKMVNSVYHVSDLARKLRYILNVQ